MPPSSSETAGGGGQPKRKGNKKTQDYLPPTGRGEPIAENGVLSRKKAESGHDSSMSSECRQRVKAALESISFDVGICFVIVMNSVFLGVEITVRLETNANSAALVAFEVFFLLVYSIELFMRFFAAGCREAIRQRWVQFDTLLLLLGIAYTCIIEPLSVEGSAANTLGPIMMLRTLRLLRLVRTFRLFQFLSKFRDFWLMLRGFMNGLSLMACTALMLFIILYVFACLGVEVVANHSLNRSSSVFKSIVDEHFSSIPLTMLTLLRFAVLDNASAVYMPLVKEDPWLVIYFMFLVLLLSLVSFNLIAATVSHSSREQGLMDSDATLREQDDTISMFLLDLRRMFSRVDADGSGQLSLKELMKIHPSDMTKLAKALSLETPQDIFKALDTDGSGEISITEFFDGASDIILNQQASRGLFRGGRMERQVESMHWKLKDLLDIQHTMDISINKALRLCAETQSSVYSSAHKVPDGLSSSQLKARLDAIWEHTAQQTIAIVMQQVEEDEGIKAKVGASSSSAAKKRVGSAAESGLRGPMSPAGSECSFSDISDDASDSRNNRSGTGRAKQTKSKKKAANEVQSCASFTSSVSSNSEVTVGTVV